MTQAPTPGPLSGSVEGRLTAMPWKPGDPLPAVGSAVLVSGANCDVDSDQHRAFMWRTVVGYGDQDRFVCLQTGSCWPTVERLENCWFAEIPTPRIAPTAPVEASGSALHPATSALVDRFAAELKSKLARAEAKYGYRDDWSKPDWKDDLIESLAEHIQKGDPRDVAAYCAFAWHHGWSTSDAAGHSAPALRPQPSGETREVAQDIASLKGQFERIFSRSPEDRPAYKDGGQPFGHGDLRHFIKVLGKAEALLSARPLALGDQQGVQERCQRCGGEVQGWLCQSCPAEFRENDDGHLVFDEDTTPARAEAQDEGAAGECGKSLGQVAYEGWAQGLPVCEWAKQTRTQQRAWENAAQAVIDAHPYPIPAADADRVRIAVEALPNGTYQKSETVTATAEGEETFAELRQLVATALPEPFKCLGGTDRIRKGDPVPGSKDRTYDDDRQAHVAFVAHHPRQALAALKSEGK